MSAALHWVVIAVLGSDEHATADEATLCSWTPEPWPVVCDLLVRQVRSDDGRRRGRRRGRDRQLEMFGDSVAAERAA